MFEPLGVKEGDAVAICRRGHVPERREVVRVTPTGLIRLDNDWVFRPDGRPRGDDWGFRPPRLKRWDDLDAEEKRAVAVARLEWLCERLAKAPLPLTNAACEHMEYLLRGADGGGSDAT